MPCARGIAREGAELIAIAAGRLALSQGREDGTLGLAKTDRVDLYRTFVYRTSTFRRRGLRSSARWNDAHSSRLTRFGLLDLGARDDVADQAGGLGEVIGSIPEFAEEMRGADVVYHFASNPDISKAVARPDIDFWEGTLLTNNVVEAMRANGVSRVLYASGSGVYGDAGAQEVSETYSPMRPISTYGASKLAGEALIASYCFMFDLSACVFRFGNVVGPRQTHGVGFDFAAPAGTQDATGTATATYTLNGVTGILNVAVAVAVSALQFVTLP